MHRAARLILFLLAAAWAKAHPILQNIVWIEATPQCVTLNLEVSVRELIVVQGLPVAEDGSADLEEATDLAGRHGDYVLDHFHIKADDTLLKGTITNIVPPKRIGTGLEGPDRAHFTYTISYPLEKPPAVFEFTQDMCKEFPSSPGVPWDLSYATRYGPPENPIMKMSVLYRDSRLRYNTGFADAEVAGSTVVEARPLTWAALWILFIAAIVLGGGLGSLWYRAGAILWLGGYLAAPEFMPRAFPLWPLALLCGVAAILAAVDNIYSRGAEPHPNRRRVLFLAGCLLFGLGLSVQQPPFDIGHREWGGSLVLSALVAALALAVLPRFLRQRAAAERLVVQFSSLAICTSAVWLMLRILGIVA
jgi:hypothetical protein